jgi:hypothetical protein
MELNYYLTPVMPEYVVECVCEVCAILESRLAWYTQHTNNGLLRWLNNNPVVVNISIFVITLSLVVIAVISVMTYKEVKRQGMHQGKGFDLVNEDFFNAVVLKKDYKTHMDSLFARLDSIEPVQSSISQNESTTKSNLPANQDNTTDLKKLNRIRLNKILKVVELAKQNKAFESEIIIPLVDIYNKAVKDEVFRKKFYNDYSSRIYKFGLPDADYSWDTQNYSLREFQRDPTFASMLVIQLMNTQYSLLVPKFDHDCMRNSAMFQKYGLHKFFEITWDEETPNLVTPAIVKLSNKGKFISEVVSFGKLE